MFEKIKTKVKSLLVTRGLKFSNFRIEKVIWQNVFNTGNEKTVLIVHVPFVSKENIKKRHTSYQESYTICESFKELGYNVDILPYNKLIDEDDLDFEKYNLCFGQGKAFESLFFFKKSKDLKKIFYSTGINHFLFAEKTKNALLDFKSEYGIVPTESSLLNAIFPSYQTLLSEYVYVLGNQYTLSTFNGYTDRNRLREIPAFFYKTIEIDWSQKDFSNRKDFLWIGSIAAINRGLHIAIKYFKQNPDLTLHILGNYSNEEEFIKLMEIDAYPNIIFYGFTPIDSITFKNLVYKCNFLIYLSYGEGGAPSVLTGIGNGGLIPIITQECSVDICDFGIIVEHSIISLDKGIDRVKKLENNEVEYLCKRAYTSINSNNTHEVFSNTIKENFKNDLNALSFSNKSNRK